MRPIGIPAQIKQLANPDGQTNEAKIAAIQENYRKITSTSPEVSIVIPAYNEEKDILQTLCSLSANVTSRKVEIIVVNNNSKDNTEALVRASGVTCVNEYVQGITAARNAGLRNAKGTYILNADADTLYPKDWIELMVAPLANRQDIAITYGRFSFIPTGNTGRFTYFFYEYIGDMMRYINKYFREEAVNVYGFNSCYRREQGNQVEGYNHPKGANEDGWLALKLRNKGFGKLHYVTDIRALVWTTDRRIQMDGGLIKGIVKRIKRIVFKKGEQHSGLK
jgi:glycosyltransferase involved in cell wall biosynthesis